MAEVSETLEYRFEESGLDDLRRDMKRLSGDVEDLGDEFSQLGTEAEGGTEAAEEAVEDLKRTVSRIDFDELGDEAMEAADEVALAASLMEEELEGVQEALNDISTMGARRQMRRLGQEVENVLLKTQALDAQSIDIDADVDRDVDRDSFGGGRGRLPGELDEVQEAFTFFGTLSTKTKALIGATAAATAALGAAGGLAAAAVKASNAFGDLDIKRDLQKAKLDFQGVAQLFSAEFEPVLRSEVIPAAEVLADSLRDASDEAATFTREVAEFVRNAAEQDPSTTGGIASIIGEIAINPIGFAGRQAERLTGFRPRFPIGADREGGEAGIPTPQGAQELQGGIGVVRRKLKAALRRARLLNQAGADRQEVLQAQVSALEDARKKALKLAGQFEKGTGAARLAVQFVENLQQRLADARSEAENLDNALPDAPEVPQVTPQDKVISQQVQFQSFGQLAPQLAAFNRLSSRLQRINSLPFLPKAGKARKRTRAVVAAVRRLQQQGGLLSKTALKGFLRDLDLSEKQIKRIIKRLKQARQAGVNFGKRLKQSLKTAGVRALTQSIQTLGSAMAGAKNTAEKLKRTLTSVIKSAGSILLRIGIASGNPALIGGGAFASLLGGAISSLDVGGKILSDGIAKVHEGETVIPADATRSLETLVQPAQPSAQPAAAGGGSPLTIRNEIEITGELRGRGSDIVTTIRKALNEERRVGGPGNFQSPRY